MKLYAHSFSFILNFQKGHFDVNDLLNFAFKNGLQGIDIYIDSGGKIA